MGCPRKEKKRKDKAEWRKNEGSRGSKTKKGERSFFKDVSRENHERPNEVKETRRKQPQRWKEDRRRGEVGDADDNTDVVLRLKALLVQANVDGSELVVTSGKEKKKTGNIFVSVSLDRRDEEEDADMDEGDKPVKKMVMKDKKTKTPSREKNEPQKDGKDKSNKKTEQEGKKTGPNSPTMTRKRNQEEEAKSSVREETLPGRHTAHSSPGSRKVTRLLT